MGTRARTNAGAVVVTLRAARPADVEAMFGIERASFTDPWSRQALMVAIQSPALQVLVAETDAPGPAILGYSVVARAADEAEVLNLAVLEEARGKGIGAALLERAVSDAREWGASALFLEVRDSNTGARRLYARAGFEEVGRRRGYYRRPSEDALILRRVVE